ncbi:MAG: FdtA/QdtA family cupin domain-containing protein [Faecalicatena sp.]|uniref:sugar 3,4-ketoisomerase n=1 Tax=Faecalicatena sp. TaxID=2005360 RepID=UPI0025852D93|nr:FdtA/QdtA family cupin domain-containing protein [Faecalicatena sp.]MCI6465348.1 FdtA/QdtA family cupin domain-containing protein [Faecalicatena sp.]MDY4669453.1 FdtA/QdtA family cupin domain-containing protein [Oliverpabstia sp.]MDY5617490.1 FdtA/QdtA family cupin domain-containing protein [Lachnospiraceae bacterium]
MNYKMINIRTVMNQGNNKSGLSFVENEHDIPFKIKRMYFIYKEEEELQKGFYLHEKSCHLFFCPNGKININIDKGDVNTVVSLDDPSKGLLIQSDLWREIEWKTDGSVLCIATAEHYQPHRYKRDYIEYLKYLESKDVE